MEDPLCILQWFSVIATRLMLLSLQWQMDKLAVRLFGNNICVFDSPVAVGTKLKYSVAMIAIVAFRRLWTRSCVSGLVC